MRNNRKYSKKLLLGLFVLIALSSIISDYALGYTQIEPFEPQHIEEGAIPNRGPFRDPDPMEFRCYLEAGHKYHIFLVGDWISNSSDATDYDIEVRNPSNVVVSINTESAGLPEQVANDEKHQFFIPAQTGDYRFLIYNDPEDSPLDSADAADFLIIEHLEMNTVYKKELFGKPNVGADYPDGYKIAYELNTTESEFLLKIKVPDPVPVEGITGLDMYEARVYPMATAENDTSYNIQGVAVPFGERLYEDGVDGEFGGYNTRIEGFRYPEMRISCESAGVDMTKLIQIQETNSSQNIYFYLVLLAEYFEGEVEFYLKTDYSNINLTLIETPDVGYTGESTLIKVKADAVSNIRSMWIDYTTDNWDSYDTIQLMDKTSYWLAVLPSFDLHDNVKYRIHALDEIDNKGKIEGDFTVMNKVDIEYGLSGDVIKGGQTLKISGSATRPSINLQINIEHSGNTNSISIQTDGLGDFTYDYKPEKIGEYDVTISYAGDEDYHSAISREKSFRVDKRELDVETSIDVYPIKVERPMTIEGRVIPPVSQIEVEFIFVNPETSFTEKVVTDNNGLFSLMITPGVTGNWDMLPQLKVSDVFDTSQVSMASFDVQSLSLIDTVEYQAMQLIEPPLLYVVVGIIVILIVFILQRTGILNKLRGEEEIEEPEEEENNNGATAYKRRSSR